MDKYYWPLALGFLICACLGSLTASSQVASDLPPGFELETVASGFMFPVAAEFAPDGRIFVAEKGGVVKIFENGAVLPDPFITLTDVNDFNDRGLLDIALDPDFESNNFVYLLYTYENNSADYEGSKTARLVRVTANGNIAVPGSEFILLGSAGGSNCEDFAVTADCIPSNSGSHTIGSVMFAPDETIFVSAGDSASFTEVDPLALRSQNIDSLAGKILHIDRDGNGLATNPFWNGSADDNRSKVWAYGFRNPFRFGLKPGTGVPFVADVGWFEWEEVNVATPGSNFGWPCWEGANHQNGYESFPECQALYSAGTDTKPLYFYLHPPGAAIVGGDFYSGSSYPAEYQGAFFFADYARSQISYLKVDPSNNLIPGSVQNLTLEASAPVQIFSGPNTDLYYVSIFPGDIVRIKYSSDNQSPIAVAGATPTEGLVPLEVQFSSAGSADPDSDPVEFLWSFGDGTPDSIDPNPAHIYSADGVFDPVLVVTDSFGAKSSDTIEIRVGTTPPFATLNLPADETFYNVGDTVNYSGSGFDNEDGELSGVSLTWQVIVHHCPFGTCHSHILFTGTGSGGSFVMPDHGDESYLEIIFKAKDSSGLEDTERADIRYNMVPLRFETAPGDLTLVYDGISRTAPFTINSAVGSTRTLEAPSPQGVSFFDSWSDGQAAQHNITVPATATTYVANYVSSSAFVGEYFNNMTLAGPHVLQRFDPSINFAWGDGGSPDPRINPDQFSARWTKQEIFEAGTYAFTVTADDGFRLFVDDVLIMDEWHNQPATTYTVEQVVTAGAHTIRMEYYEDGWNAVAKLSYGPIGGCEVRGAKADIANYTSGDAKWYFAEVPVSAGGIYHFSDYYKSNVTTALVAQVRIPGDTFEYIWLGEVEVSSEWKKMEASFTMPAGAISATVFHLIRDVGTLEIDGVSFMADGSAVNLVSNPSLESSGPSGWIQNS